MILTVTLNPAIDRIYYVDNFKTHKLHRLMDETQSIMSPGGKGVNIAIALQRMGIPTVAMGIAGGHRGMILAEDIRKEGITTDFIHTANETRTNVSLIDTVNNTLTEINESGKTVDQEDLDMFLENYKKILNDTRLVVIAGAIPPKVPNNIYGELVRLANEKNVKTIVHASPKFLEYAIEAEAFMINPDMRSSHELYGKPLDGIDEFCCAGEDILKKRKKTEIVLFSHRLENVVAATRDTVYILRPEKLQIKNMLGYGDAVVSGFIYGLENKFSLLEALRFGCAAGLTNVEHIEKLSVDLEKIKSNLPRIKVEETTCK